MEMKIYEGKRLRTRGIPHNVVVTVNGKPLRHRIRHSPTGFEFGYGGSGPADLALSILWDFLGEEPSRSLYIDFKDQFVAEWKDKWEITSAEIQRWIQLRIEPGGLIKRKMTHSKSIDLQNRIKDLIGALKEEKEYYKWDVRYGLYETMIDRLKALIEEEGD